MWATTRLTFTLPLTIWWVGIGEFVLSTRTAHGGRGVTYEDSMSVNSESLIVNSEMVNSEW